MFHRLAGTGFGLGGLLVGLGLTFCRFALGLYAFLFGLFGGGTLLFGLLFSKLALLLVGFGGSLALCFGSTRLSCFLRLLGFLSLACGGPGLFSFHGGEPFRLGLFSGLALSLGFCCCLSFSLAARFGGSFEALALDRVIEVSSTALRAGMASGTSEAMLEPQVYGYILREHLYGTNLDLKRLTVQQLRPIALSYLKAKRCAHVLGTAATAVKLAEKYGVDVHRAEVAGLLHDCTKKLSMPEQLALCEKYGIALDELEKKALKLLHAKTGAALARDVFGVDDEIYNAILWHTTGKPDMTVLEKVIYLADFIEPTRDFPGVDALRRTVWEDLDRGLLMGLEMTVEEMEEMGNPIHVNTLAARDYLKGKTNEGKAGSGQQL